MPARLLTWAAGRAQRSATFALWVAEFGLIEHMTETNGARYAGLHRQLTLTLGSKTFSGQWVVADGFVTVWMGSIGPHSAHLGGMRPASLARILLNEIIAGAESRAKLDTCPRPGAPA